MSELCDDEEDTDSLGPTTIEDEAQERFDVEAITNRRTDMHGNVQYLVRWDGHVKPTWEPAETMQADAPEAVREFENSQGPDPASESESHGPAKRTDSRHSQSQSCSTSCNCTPSIPSAFEQQLECGSSPGIGRRGR